MTPAPEGGRRLVRLAAGALGFSCIVTQLALMRELLGAFSGNEMVLGVVLGLWLLLMGMGTWLGRTSDKFRNPLVALAAIQMVVAILPLFQVFLLRALRNVVFIRGATVGVAETALGAFVLLLPYCLAAGYALTLACSLLARLDGSGRVKLPTSPEDFVAQSARQEARPPDRRVDGMSSELPGTPAATGSEAPLESAAPELAAGRVYIADTVGSIGGGILFSFVLVRFLDHISILVYPALLNLLVAWVIAFHNRRRWLGTVAMALAAGVVAATVIFDLDAISTGLQYPRSHIVARANSPYGKLLVTESDGQFDFIENGLPLTSTRDDQHVEETVHYAMAQRPDARNVLLVAGGISGTAKEILKYGVHRVDYVELDPLILELGRKYLPDSLADHRIRVITDDGRRFVKQATDQYDVAIIDVPAPSTAQLNRFYTVQFLREVKRTLAPHGVLSFSLGHYENYVSPELARLLASAHRSLKQSFPNVLLIPGARVCFLASDGPLFDDIATQIEKRGVKTRLVNRHYLGAILTADRMMDMRRAIEQPAGLNTDFSPVLYYYHLRHWLSQFQTRFGALQVLLLILPAIYLARLRGATFVLFASGFAGTALEVVLLLAFQVLCGSVYHQVGVIVTVFMAGLALGAWVANRSLNGRDALPRRQVGPAQWKEGGEKGLAVLAFAISGYALLLPLCLPLLSGEAASAGSLLIVKTAIALLTFTLAVLVGMQFPLANRLAFDGTVAGASRLYTADFAGAALGAWLSCTLLIPLIGVTGVCLLTAALNLLGGVIIQFRKAAI